MYKTCRLFAMENDGRLHISLHVDIKLPQPFPNYSRSSATDTQITGDTTANGMILLVPKVGKLSKAYWNWSTLKKINAYIFP